MSNEEDKSESEEKQVIKDQDDGESEDGSKNDEEVLAKSSSSKKKAQKQFDEEVEESYKSIATDNKADNMVEKVTTPPIEYKDKFSTMNSSSRDRESTSKNRSNRESSEKRSSFSDQKSTDKKSKSSQQGSFVSKSTTKKKDSKFASKSSNKSTNTSESESQKNTEEEQVSKKKRAKKESSKNIKKSNDRNGSKSSEQRDGGSSSRASSNRKSKISKKKSTPQNEKRKSRSREEVENTSSNQTRSTNRRKKSSCLDKLTSVLSSQGAANQKTSKTSGSHRQGVHLKQGSKVRLTGAKIGFIGAGKMTDAIVRGLLVYAKADPKKMFIAAKTIRNLNSFKSKGITTTIRSYDIFGIYDCDIVFLCVHGFVVKACFKGGGTRPFAMTTNYIPNQKHPLYILSLIGGVSLNDIRVTLLNPENPEKYLLEIHRVMLNIGVAYGFGMGAIDVEIESKMCSPVVRDLLLALTKEMEYLPEELIDVACVVSGIGLAFCYYWISAMSEGGFQIGLNKFMSIKLSCKALQSAAQALLESNQHPSHLQDAAVTQAGPVIYGINMMNKRDCRDGLITALEQSLKRLKDMVDPEIEIKTSLLKRFDQKK